MIRVPESYRLTRGMMASDQSYGCNGVFMIPAFRKTFQCIVSDGMEWEHVSVVVIDDGSKTPKRCPTWDEMQRMKEIFWEPEDVVMELHVADSDHRNVHEFCLHLWRPITETIPLPDKIMVG